LLIALRLNRDAEDFAADGASFFRDGRHQRGDFDLRRCGLPGFYAGSWQGIYGTSYGLILSAKIV